MNHTPEPWALYESNGCAGIVDKENCFIISSYMCGGDDMRRIVACVNACAGVDITDDFSIRKLCIDYISSLNQREELKQQHDELLSAAIFVANDLHDRGIVYPALDKAIAKAGVR